MKSQKEIDMRYLITMTGQEPFFTDWFSPENHFLPECGMVVYDLDKNVYTDDGKDWKVINQDKL